MQTTSQPNRTSYAKHLLVRYFNLFVLTIALIFALPAHAGNRAVTKRVNPTYPELARRMRIGGIVKIEATVAADGTVLSVKTTYGNRMISSAAEEAVSKWKFAPGDDKSIETVELNFALPN